MRFRLSSFPVARLSGMHHLLALLLATVAVPALAQTPPVCAPVREGMVACFGEKLCRCRWQAGGALIGRPAGFRWDCGALRPACGVAPAGPEAPAAPFLMVPTPGR